MMMTTTKNKTKLGRLIMVAFVNLLILQTLIGGATVAASRTRPIKYYRGDVIPSTPADLALLINKGGQSRRGGGRADPYIISWPSYPPQRGGPNESVDLSTLLPPIADQGRHQSCSAWVSTYYFLTYEAKYDNGLSGQVNTNSWDITKPEYQFSPAFTYDLLNGGKDQSISLLLAFYYLRVYGAPTLAQWDNFNSPLNDTVYNQAAHYIPQRTLASQISPTINGGVSVSNIIGALNRGHLVGIATPQYVNMFTNSGLITDPITTPNPGDFASGNFGEHAFTIVGYSSRIYTGRDGYGAFKIANNYGTKWGSGGFAWLSYKYVATLANEIYSFAD